MADLTYTLTLADGRVVSVKLPLPISFSPGVTDDVAHAAIAFAIAEQARGQLSDMPLTKRVVRGPDGQISALVELPHTTADEIASQIGRAVATQLLAEPEDAP